MAKKSGICDGEFTSPKVSTSLSRAASRERPCRCGTKIQTTHLIDCMPVICGHPLQASQRNIRKISRACRNGVFRLRPACARPSLTGGLKNSKRHHEIHADDERPRRPLPNLLLEKGSNPSPRRLHDAREEKWLPAKHSPNPIKPFASKPTIIASRLPTASSPSRRSFWPDSGSSTSKARLAPSISPR